jgi:predicted acyltransferase
VAKPSPDARGADRIASLDQFRGYTVAGMLLVNFLGGFSAVHALLKHHNTYCSYADTIMPHFFFAVGFAFRLTYLRRGQAAKTGDHPQWRRVARRVAGLLLLGFVIYHLDGRYTRWEELREAGLRGVLASSFQRSFFQTLTHIGIATLWVLPVIARSARARLLFAVGSGLLHVGLSAWFNYDWVFAPPRGIDGGPLGFLTWSIPLIAGTLAYDVVARARGWRQALRLLGWGIAVGCLGWALSMPAGLYQVPVAEQQPVSGEAEHAASPVLPPLGRAFEDPSLLLVEPPFTPPPPPAERRLSYWHMSQRAGSLSYHVFAAGLSLAVYALFILLSDMGGLRVGLFRTFGSNALLAYILDILVADAIKPFCPRDAPLAYAVGAFCVHLLIVWLMVRSLEKRGVYVRI